MKNKLKKEIREFMENEFNELIESHELIGSQEFNAMRQIESVEMTKTGEMNEYEVSKFNQLKLMEVQLDQVNLLMADLIELMVDLLSCIREKKLI